MRMVKYNSFLCGDKFDAWKIRAKLARERMLNLCGALKFNDEIWRELKGIILDGNHGRCMYCEGNYTAGAHGDAEHYRPKKKVTAWSEILGAREDIDHPGYFWLAYEWQNILLACTKCNGQHPDGENNKPHPGKLNEFPLPLGKQRCKSPGGDPERWWDELKAEEPLLLHPYFDKCEEHFEAKMDGVIYGVTVQGKVTIRTCDLNRPHLRKARANFDDNLRATAALICSYHLKRRSIEVFAIHDECEFVTYQSKKLLQYVNAMLSVEGSSLNLSKI